MAAKCFRPFSFLQPSSPFSARLGHIADQAKGEAGGYPRKMAAESRLITCVHLSYSLLSKSKSEALISASSIYSVRSSLFLTIHFPSSKFSGRSRLYVGNISLFYTIAPHRIGANGLNSVLKGTAAWYAQCMSSCTKRMLHMFP